MHQREHDQAGRHALGERGSQRHARLRHTEDDHEEQVEEDVQHAGDREKEQRPPRVAGRGEDAVAEVEDGHRWHSQQIDAQIADRAFQQLVLGAQQPQHGGCQQEAREQEEHARRQQEDRRRVYGLGNVLMPARAEIARGDHVDAAAHTDQEAREQADQDRGRSDRPQSPRPGKAPDHGDVRHIEQHLQNVGSHQRQAEPHNRREQRPRRQGKRLHLAHA